MTPAEIDESDLDFLLDMEVLDSKIDAAFEAKRPKTPIRKTNKKSTPKQRPFSGGTAFIDQIMNF